MNINVFLQNDKNSCFRNKYDEKTLEFQKRERLLYEAKYQYGFIPETIGDDGDCLDIWLISERNHKTGTLMPCRIIGALEMFEEYRGEKESDIKILVCPENEDQELTEEIAAEIKTFTLKIFKKFPEVKVSFGQKLTSEEAEQLL